MRVIYHKLELIPPPSKGNDLHFAIATQPRVESFWRSLVVLLSRQKRFTPLRPAYMFRGLNNRWFQTPAQSLVGSSAINIILVFALLWFVKASAIATNNSYEVNSEPQWIYYNVPTPTPNRTRLKITPSGPGGVPGQGQLKDKKTALGSTVFHPTLSVISQPLHPDNSHQTILQPDAPPNSLLNKDFDLPNILPTSANLPLRPSKLLTWTAPKPNPRTGQPTVEATLPTDSNPNSNSTITILGATTPDPALPVPPQPSPTQVNSDLDSKMGAVSTLQQNNVASGDGSGIVVVSTNPNGAVGMVGLPFGNRMGSFSISPYGTSTGSPGGAKGGSESGGVGAGGAVGTGGDGSVGVGSGNSGGGQGGSTNDSGVLSMSGTDGGKGGGYNLPSAPVISDMVIPITSKLQLRKNALTISAGPMGGGGLAVYQALPCAKIYTIFLPMPGTNWTLQYCARDDSGAKQLTVNGNSTLRLAEGLVAPQPQTEFDFQRLPISVEKIGKMIVLKGEIRDDGTVSDVQIYAGVMPTMDEAARLAFSQWKFIPAMRSGKPVGVKVLVGIAANPQSHQ